MQLIRVGAAVLNQTPLDWDRNLANIGAAIAAAREDGVTVLCLPELCLTGYGCEDAFQSPAVLRTAWEALHEVLPQTRGIVVSLGLPVFVRTGIFNAACLVADGRILGFAAKRFLPFEGIHYEPRWFRPWPEGTVATLDRDGDRHPIGDLLFDVGGVRIGFEICEDAWVGPRPGYGLARRGVDVILNPSASHFAFGKHRVRQRFVLEGSRFFGVAYVYANLLGNEAGRAIYDGDALIAAAGELVAQGPRFSFADHVLTTAVVDLDRCRMKRAKTSGTEVDVAARELEMASRFAWPDVDPDPVPEPADETMAKEEEFARATALGLFDYLRKTESRGYVVSLSGGADSSAVACLVRLMLDLAEHELGPAGVADRLAHVPGLASTNGRTARMRALLTTLYQATANSSNVTRNAARAVADAIGAHHLELDVEPLVRGYVATIERAIERGLTWQDDDLALQNIQARCRAPSAWLIANVLGALLLSTSNRSEAAVGYATMDGDTAGGLAPIAGIDKTFLRGWLRWLEHHAPTGSTPIPALSAVNAQQPTAELRPPAAAQSDEDDLMPYPVLDAMERAAIRDKQGPLEVWRAMRRRFAEHDDGRLAQWTERFFRLWARNQWKRERYAPSFHLDDENLDPKTWCRFPILSGGFEREIQELRRHAGESAAVTPRAARPSPPKRSRSR